MASGFFVFNNFFNFSKLITHLKSQDDTITGNSFSSSGTTHALGQIAISGSTISSSTNASITINDNLILSTGKTLTVDNITSNSASFVNFGSKDVATDGHFYTASTNVGGVVFEGSTADNFETQVFAIDPTADREIGFPNETGTVITTGSTDAITESMVANDAIGQNELKTVVTLQILNSSGTALKTLYGAGA